MMEELLTLLVKRNLELERIRTRSLATQQWHKVIRVEGQIDENEIIRLEMKRMMSQGKESAK